MGKVSKFSRSALRSLGAGLSRLDELGGDARDRILEWLEESPTAARVREIVRQRREARDAEIAEAVAVDAGERRQQAAATPVPEVPAEPLGDPAIAAQIYGKRSCPWSGRSVRLLEDRDVVHQFIDLDDSENEVLGNRLIAETRQNTVPYIYIRGKFIGGFNALSEIDRLGQLESLSTVGVGTDGDRPGRIVVEIAERDNTDEVAPGETSRRDLN